MENNDRDFLEQFKDMRLPIFNRYRELNGKLNEIEFTRVLGEFYEYTFDSYIIGDGKLHGDRQESWDKWKEASNITNPEACRIFQAVDSLYSYT